MTLLMPEDERLVAAFVGLGNLNRLAILRALRVPRHLGEIVIPNEGQGAPLARQTVRRHLDELLAVGLAEARDEAGDGSPEYVVNHQRLFTLSEDVRALAALRPAVEPDPDTATLAAKPSGRSAGPCLVLTRGLGEGRRFALSPSDGTTRWIIGRRRHVAVPLDFDSATSGENAEVLWTGTEHTVLDLPGSKNGTSVNFERLTPGRPTPLRHGDIVGVGRCLLVYWR